MSRLHQGLWYTAVAVGISGLILAFMTAPGATVVLSSVIGWTVVILVVAVTSPAAVRFCSGCRPSMKQHPTTSLRWNVVIEAMACSAGDWAGLGSAGSLCACTDERLCELWVESTRALDVATSSRGRSLQVEARAAYLQEMERRNACGVMAWLVDDGVAANPLRFLVQHGRPAPVVDWDQLIP